MAERPRVPGPILEQPESVIRSAALYVMRRKYRHPEAMWELLEILGLDSKAQELLLERLNGSA